jgi:CRP-like cAMP-binding protein
MILDQALEYPFAHSLPPRRPGSERKIRGGGSLEGGEKVFLAVHRENPRHREVAKGRSFDYAAAMASILDQIKEYPARRYEAGEIVLEQGTTTGKLFFLAEGAVEIVKDGVRVVVARETGAVFGEMSAFLQAPHAATVRAVEPCVFHEVGDARQALETDPALCFHVCGIMAHRLEALIGYLVNVKQQYEGHDHVAMVEGVLESLMRRQPRKRVRPSESTIRKGQVLD